MKSLEERQKQLEMALISHESLIIDLGDNQELLLKWDEIISNYRGYSKKLDIQIGIWYMEYLLKIASGKTKYRLVVVNE